jgi:predicted transcriptional regulator
LLQPLVAELKTLARKKGKGTELSVFKGREARLNRAIFETLASERPQNISSLQKRLNKQKGLGGTYYASLNKRIRSLENSGFVSQSPKPEEGGSKAAIYELRPKAFLASFLDSISIEELLSNITDTNASILLLSLIRAISVDGENNE